MLPVINCNYKIHQSLNHWVLFPCRYRFLHGEDKSLSSLRHQGRNEIRKFQAPLICYGPTSYEFGHSGHARVEVSAAMTNIFRFSANHLVDSCCVFCFFPRKEYLCY